MANEEQLTILRQGVKVWNKWREENPDVGIDLGGEEFTLDDFTGVDFHSAYLGSVDFTTVTLWQANFNAANLMGANLYAANLTEANLIGSNFLAARVGYTIFGNSDLSETLGLEEVIHDAPSIIGIDTIVKFKGKIPNVFLRGCGLSDWEIESVKLHNPDLSNEEINKILYKMYDLRAS